MVKKLIRKIKEKLGMAKKDKGPKEYAVVEAFNLVGGFGAGERDNIVCFILDLEDVDFFSKNYIKGPGRLDALVLNRYGKQVCKDRDYCRIHKKEVVDLSKVNK